MKLTVSGLGGKHEIDLLADDTIRSVKQRLEPLTSLSAVEMKLLVKGKAPDDSAKFADLGLSGDNVKVMLMRSAKGAKTLVTAPASSATIQGAPAWLAVGATVDYVDGSGACQTAMIKAVHTDDPTGLYCTISIDGTERQTPLDRLRLRGSAADTIAAAGSAPAAPAGLTEAGEGSITLTVSNGKRLLTLRCEASTSVSELKALLAPLTGAEAATMKLLHKGKEALNTSSVDDLGLSPAGGRLMLLFKARHHREVEGAEAVASCAERLAALRETITKTRHRITKRLMTGAEAVAELGGLDGEVAALLQDLRNAAPNESSSAAKARASQLDEAAALASALSEARQEETLADLRAQTGR